MSALKIRTTENTSTLNTPIKVKIDSRLESGVPARSTFISANPAKIADRNKRITRSIHIPPFYIKICTRRRKVRSIKWYLSYFYKKE